MTVIPPYYTLREAFMDLRDFPQATIEVVLVPNGDQIITTWKIWDGTRYHRGNTLFAAIVAAFDWKISVTPRDDTIDMIERQLNNDQKND